MTIEAALTLCVVNGYPKRSREALDQSGVTQAHDLYLNFLRTLLPNAQLDVLFIADPDVGLPQGAVFPSYDGYIWTGSNLTIYHDEPEVSRQIDFCRAVYEAGVPQFGSCWGIQIAALASGGEVKKNPNGREWSIARGISLNADGRSHPMFRGKPERFDAFIMHLDEVTALPETGTLLASNDHTHVQALAVRYPGGGEFCATQYHPEFTLYEMARLLVARKKYLVAEGFFDQENEVDALGEQMTELSRQPDNVRLRRRLAISDDLLDDKIRQTEVRNWLSHLVLTEKARRMAA